MKNKMVKHKDSVKEAFALNGRVAVITGGAGLLGAKHAEAIAEMGGIPILIDIDEKRAQECAQEIANVFGVKAKAYYCDITNEEADGYNIIAKYIYKDMSLNRKEVNTRVTNLKADSYEAKNFNSNEIKSITEKSKSCDNICALQNNTEVNLYLKYCMFNVTKCNMKEVGKIK